VARGSSCVPAEHVVECAWFRVAVLACALFRLILDGKASCVDLRPFDPARFAPAKKGGRGRKRGETSVGEQW
jgi:hypothetical protein